MNKQLEELNVSIDDKELEQQYFNREQYGPIHRFIIEKRYERALSKKVTEDYEKLKHKSTR